MRYFLCLFTVSPHIAHCLSWHWMPSKCE